MSEQPTVSAEQFARELLCEIVREMPEVSYKTKNLTEAAKTAFLAAKHVQWMRFQKLLRDLASEHGIKLEEPNTDAHTQPTTGY